MRFAKLFALALVAGGCHHGGRSNGDGGTTPPKTVANSVPLIVDGNDQSFNVPYISIQVCAPGSTTKCATIDHVLVDTGSIGLRIPSGTFAATPGLLDALPSQKVGGANAAECYVYASGFFFGSVKLVDLTIAGETSANMPVQIGGDLTAPTSCSNLSPGAMEIDTAAALQGNAIIGVAPLKLDCGAPCESPSAQMNPIYYTCTAGGTCSQTAMPEAEQVPQPISTFAQDNNGYVMELPSVDDTMGATSPMGTMTFGIDTQDDNKLGSQTVYQASTSMGLPLVTATIGSSTFPGAVFDSGTPLYVVTLPQTECTGDFEGLYCPTSLQSLSTTVTDATGATGKTTVKIANAETVLGNSPQTTTAFDDIGEDASASGLPSGLFIIGLTHFYGKTMYFGMDGDMVGTKLTGPFYAF